jgi:putative aldouronate transport system permease protein
MEMQKFRQSAGDKVFNGINRGVFALFALICLWPFYYLIINTISNNNEVFLGNVVFLPKGINFKNYARVFQMKGIFSAAYVSVARTVIGTVFAVVSASFLGYCMTKTYFWHRKFWYRYLIVTMYFSAGLIPWYMVMHILKMNNNFLAYILPSLHQSFNVILMKTYIESLPPSMEESAEIDGAGSLRRYLSIVIPLTTPILATVAIFAALGHWNTYTDTLFLVTKDELYTLQYLLYKYLHESERLAALLKANVQMQAMMGAAGRNIIDELTPTAVRYTVSVVAVLPILYVYPFFQR